MAFHPDILIQNIEEVIVGKRRSITEVVAALLAGGHVLIEDVPGVGKTVLAKALARSIQGSFKRIQFTPDLLPSDITGVGVFNEQSREFEFRRGPAFANILLADELNRATPRTQSAMLECMDERQATVDGRTHALPHPFFVIATQNPIEQEGVYRLPEAQLDRFLMKIALGYPAEDEETRILAAQRRRHPLEALRPAAAIEDILESQRDAARIHVAEPIANYIVRIVAATRDQKDLQLGASPRASLALMRCCQALALITRQSFVTPDMVKAMAIPVLRHRLILLPRARISGRTADQTIHSILRQVEVPVCDYGPAQ